MTMIISEATKYMDSRVFCGFFVLIKRSIKNIIELIPCLETEVNEDNIDYILEKLDL